MSELPATTRRFCRLNGITLHWVEQGEGPLVVLLHGFPEGHAAWRFQLGALARAGYRVIAPDLRGYFPSSPAGPFELPTYGDDVEAIIRASGERDAHVVGHDVGGLIAWYFAAHRPAMCRRLVVLNAPHPEQVGPAVRRYPGQALRLSYLLLLTIPGISARLLTRRDAAVLPKLFRAGTVSRANFRDEEIAPYREAALQPGYARAMLGWHRATLGSLWRERPKFPHIEARTMLIWGMDDPLLRFHALVPGTERRVSSLRLEPIDHCGHFPHEEQPSRVNALLLEFLA